MPTTSLPLLLLSLLPLLLLLLLLLSLLSLLLLSKGANNALQGATESSPAKVVANKGEVRASGVASWFLCATMHCNHCNHYLSVTGTSAFFFLLRQQHHCAPRRHP